MGAKINCSICGKPADAAMENCPHCGSPVKVGRVLAPMTPAASSGPASDACPSCGAAVQAGDIVCVRCGVNLLTGDKVVKKQAEVVSAAESTRSTPYLLFGLAAAVILIVAGVAAFVLLRDPVSEARQLARSGDLLGAVNVLQKHTGAHPDDGDAFALLGQLFMQTQQYTDATSAFDTASRLQPQDADVAYMMVLAAGKLPGGTGADRQITALQRIVDNHPTETRALRMLALLNGASGKLAESTQALGTLAGTDTPATEVAKYRGIVDAIGGNYAEARASLEAAGSQDPDVRLAQGYVASLEGDTFAAADALNAAVSGTENADTEAKTRLGLLYMAQGNFDQALPLLRPSDQGRPSDSARFFYALCLQTAALEDDALLEFDKLVSGEGKFAEDAAVQMAMIYLNRDQIDRAAEATRRAQKYGSSARLLTVVGQVAALQGDDAGAQEFYRKAIQANAAYPAAHLEHGLMYIRRGALSEGVRELKQYLELAEAAIPGGRINEVDLLLKQLEQAVERDGGTS